MEIYMVEPQNKYRYEKKFLISYSNLTEFLKSIYNNCYFEIYTKRQVNNLYFDDFNFTSFNENIDGLSDRNKYRIRWYGSTFENSKKIIEIKLKTEFLNKKEKLDIGDKTLKSLSGIEYFFSDIQSELLQLKNFRFYNFINKRIPTLFNSYKRMYFSEINRKIRITVDTDLYFFSPITQIKTIESMVVVEIKYDSEDMFKNTFKNLTYTRYSKYVKGTSNTTFFKPNY